MSQNQRPKRHWPGCLLALLVVATGVKHFLNTQFDNFKNEAEHRSNSIAEAREKGTLIQELDWQPRDIVVDGQPVVLLEAWIEQRHLHSHRFVWIPSIERLDGTNLCVRYQWQAGEKWYLGNREYPRHTRWTSDDNHVYSFAIGEWDRQPLTLSVTNMLKERETVAELTFRPK
jgi:hypothetical protein